MEVLAHILFWMVVLAGLASIFFGIAGTFVIVAAALVYGWVTSFATLSVKFIGLLLAIAVVVELVEALLGAVMTRRFGGSKWGMAGAIIGGFVGAVAGTPVAPVIGTLIGGFLGAFTGAFLLEWLHTSDPGHAGRAGFGALFGAIGGKFTKLVAALAMVVLIAMRLM